MYGWYVPLHRCNEKKGNGLGCGNVSGLVQHCCGVTWVGECGGGRVVVGGFFLDAINLRNKKNALSMLNVNANSKGNSAFHAIGMLNLR